MSGRGTAEDHQKEKRGTDHEQSMLSDGNAVGGYEVMEDVKKGKAVDESWNEIEYRVPVGNRNLRQRRAYDEAEREE